MAASPPPVLQAHPWHGISPGERAPQTVTAYVEIVPTDAVKYELDKVSGHLRIDRPQRFSNFCPALYGFIPRSYCAGQVARRCRERTGLPVPDGDLDPLDICILSEKPFAHGAFLASVRPIGGLLMVDRNQADDKIIAVLEGDLAYGALNELSECPPGVVDRLRHYFLTYKRIPGQTDAPVSVVESYGADEAQRVISLSFEDYRESFGAKGQGTC